MLQWKPFQHTSVVVRYSNTHDNIRPAEGLALKPTGALNRGGDPSYFAAFGLVALLVAGRRRRLPVAI
jgi:MYXO-CTERM domain-containing protein